MLQEAQLKQPVSDLRSWKLGRQLSKPANDGATHYGKTATYASEYCVEFKRQHGEDSNPEEADIDPKVVLVAGHGKPHGRHKVADSILETDMTYSQVRVSSPSGSVSTVRRVRSRFATVSIFSPFSDFCSCMAILMRFIM